MRHIFKICSQLSGMKIHFIFLVLIMRSCQWVKRSIDIHDQDKLYSKSLNKKFWHTKVVTGLKWYTMFYIRSNLFSTGANTLRSFLLIIALIVCKDALSFGPIYKMQIILLKTTPFITTLNIYQYHKGITLQELKNLYVLILNKLLVLSKGIT